MSEPVDQKPPVTAQGNPEDNHAEGVTRRTVLAGAAASALTFGVDTNAEAQAQKANPDAPEDMDAFVKLSAALTGIAAKMLAPDTDSLGMRRVYFNVANTKRPAPFLTLLQITKSTSLQIPADPESGGIIKQADVDRLVRAIEAKGDDAKYLARSIVLLWYLGSWYAPEDLKALAGPTLPPFVAHTVISPKAYTQGWLWRVAQAHPMGFSDMQFGYWTREPQPLSDFIALRSAKG
jgi:hypothetical protein